MEQKLEQANLDLEQNCLQNFAKYLNSPTREIGKEITSEPIYDLLVRSLGSTKGGFELKDNRPRNILSGYTAGEIGQMAALARQLKQQFIDTLCEKGIAVKLMRLAKKVNDYPEGGQYAPNQQYEVDEYRSNGWMALRGCLGVLEQFMVMQMQGQRAPVPAQGEPMTVRMPARGGSMWQPNRNGDLGTMLGGKSKSRSNRKKRNSHRQKKRHSHKHRTPKRR
jgi:hypothetical protein